AWAEVRKELNTTLNAIHGPDARAEGLRRLTRKLIDRGQSTLAEELAQNLGGGPGLRAVIALEFLRAGQADRGEKLGKKILGQLASARRKPSVPVPTPTKLPPDVVTFLTIRGQETELPKAVSNEDKDIREAGKLAALAWKKDFERARREADNMHSVSPK